MVAVRAFVTGPHYTRWMAFLADLVLVVHVSFIVFVITGLLLTVAGGLAGWRWVHFPWFRIAHLAAIVVVVVQAWFGIECPLTTLENELRVAGGQVPYSENGFIADWLHRYFFFQAEPWVFAVIYTAFGLLVVGTLVLVPVGRRRKGV